jgi:hypothetical protein
MNLRILHRTVRACFCVSVLGAILVPGRIEINGFAQSDESPTYGYVRSADGTVLGQVWVQELGKPRGCFSGVSGEFQLSMKRAVTLLFVKDGFRPALRTITSTKEDGQISVVLDPEPSAALKLPLCQRHGIIPIREVVSKNMRHIILTPGKNVDFSSYVAYYEHKGSELYFASMAGVHVAGETPTPEWVAGVTSLSVRSMKCGDSLGFDLRGSTGLGVASRWIGLPGSHVEYSRIPSSVARIFDEAIDGGCCR